MTQIKPSTPTTKKLKRLRARASNKLAGAAVNLLTVLTVILMWLSFTAAILLPILLFIFLGIHIRDAF